MIRALTDQFEVILISLLPTTAVSCSKGPPIQGVVRHHALQLPTFEPGSLSAVASGASLLPRSLVETWDDSTAFAIQSIVRESRVRVAIGTDMRTLRYLTHLDSNVRKILDEPDVSFVLDDHVDVRSISENIRSQARRLKYRRLLHQAADEIDVVLVASELEAEAFRRLSGSGHVIVVENGVDEVSSKPWVPPPGNQLLYAGSLTYSPNADAVSYFMNGILPHVSSRFSDARLVVTGALPDVAPPSTAYARLRLTGRVPSLHPIYRQTRLVVVPLRSGTGTRVKILEALAAGLPVVTTSKGAEGLDVISGEHLIIADTAHEFAVSVIRLLEDPDESLRLGQHGRALVEERYNWETIGRRLRGIVEDVVHAGEPVFAQAEF